jgi:hypothetical protein
LQSETAFYVYVQVSPTAEHLHIREEITLYFIGITSKNARTASQVRLIRQGRIYKYHFWVDSERSKPEAFI